MAEKTLFKLASVVSFKKAPTTRKLRNTAERRGGQTKHPATNVRFRQVRWLRKNIQFHLVVVVEENDQPPRFEQEFSSYGEISGGNRTFSLD